MSSALHVYLNDHLAGSVIALDLLQHLITHSPDQDCVHTLTRLKGEIAEDQAILEKILAQSGGDEHSIRQAGAWLMEKLARLKLQIFSDVKAPGMHEALEGLSLGIMGKRSLWRSLEAARPLPAVAGHDFPALAARALDQFHQIEALALRFAPLALR